MLNALVDLGNQKKKSKLKLNKTAKNHFARYLSLRFPGPPPITDVTLLPEDQVTPDIVGQYAAFLISAQCPRVNKLTSVQNYVSQVHCIIAENFVEVAEKTLWKRRYASTMDSILEHYAAQSVATGEPIVQNAVLIGKSDVKYQVQYFLERNMHAARAITALDIQAAGRISEVRANFI